MDESRDEIPEGPAGRDSRAGERHAQRAAEHFRRGRLLEAETELRKAIGSDPGRGDWHFNLGLTLEASGRLEDALTAFHEASQRLPRRAETRLAEGSVLCRLGRHGDALPCLEAACSIDPRCEPAWARRIESLASLGRPEDAETAYYLAQQALERMPLCLLIMGDSQLALGRSERAAWCYREALSQEPQLPRVRAKLGRALAASGSHDAAARMYLEELRAHPGDVPTLVECGDLLASLHRPGEALEKYRRAAELAPTLAVPRARVGMLQVALGNHDEGRAELETAYGLDPEAEMVRIQLAEALAEVNDIEGALRVLREDVSRRRDLSSSTAIAETLRASELFARCGATSEGADLLERVWHSRPTDAAVVRRLMVLSFACNRSRRARGLARRLARLDPSTRVVVAHNLALDAIERGAFRLARGRLAQALEAHPGDPGLRRLRARWWGEYLRRLVLRRR